MIFYFHEIVGSNINQSLMTLGTVIRKLSDGANTAHVPFRDSKLTRILQNSLGGNTKTAIVCTVTPVERVQTKSTLEFATRSKNIVQHAHVNEVLDERAQMNRLVPKAQCGNLRIFLPLRFSVKSSLARF